MKDNCRMVMIEWYDSRQPNPSWYHLKEYKPDSVAKCISVGFLLYDDEYKKVLAPNMADIEDDDNIQASGVINIPASCVTRMVDIEEVE